MAQFSCLYLEEVTHLSPGLSRLRGYPGCQQIASGARGRNAARPNPGLSSETPVGVTKTTKSVSNKIDIPSVPATFSERYADRACYFHVID